MSFELATITCVTPALNSATPILNFTIFTSSISGSSGKSSAAVPFSTELYLPATVITFIPSTVIFTGTPFGKFATNSANSFAGTVITPFLLALTGK